MNPPSSIKHYDLIVIGGGISGLAAAFQAQRSGQSLLVLERADRCGGCFQSEIVDDASGEETFWLEMGTHTCFNSYGRLLNLLESLDLMGEMQPREKLRYRLLVDDQICAIPSRLHWLELFTHIWRIFSLQKGERAIADYYSTLLGQQNYRDLFRHAFNAVVCQPADAMPADMLFRKRPRNKAVMRSYTFPQGLGTIIEALAARLPIQTGCEIGNITRTDDGYQLQTSRGDYHCTTLICATPAPAAALLLRHAHPGLSDRLHWINEVEIESVGVVVARSALSLEPLAGIIAVDGDFYSAVSRDIVDHPTLRGFTFHFKPGRLDDDEKLARICQTLQIEPHDMDYTFYKTNRLPAPAAGHHALIAEIDALLADQPLGLVGNYFNGVAVEDCLERVEQELQRLTRRNP